MKRIYLLTILALLITAIHSCAKDDEWTQDDLPSATDKTAEDAFAMADMLYRIGAPAFFGERSSDGLPAMVGGYLSGFFVRESGSETRLFESAQRLDFNNSGMLEFANNIWSQAYRAIEKSNTLIASVAGIQELTNEQRNQLVAEARFFRAFNYFHLARWFGGLPVVTEGSLTDNVQRSELVEVYQLIVSDLEKAIPQLPNEVFSRNGFRISRPVAQTLLADVYLTMSGYPLRQNHYRQATAVARQIINSGNHTLAMNGVTPDASAFNKLRTQVDNAEHIFSFEASRSLSSLSLSRNAASWGVINVSTVNAYMPTQAFLNIYDPYKDLRIREQQFFHSFVRYEKSGRTVIQTFSRKPFWWFDRDALFGTGSSGSRVAIYRFAEVLLIAAEAIAMSEGVTSEAAGFLTDVRARAWTNISREEIYGKLRALDREQFVQEVWAERLREFPFEMKIWTDIQRTRQFPVVDSNNRGVVTFRHVIGVQNAVNVPFEEGHLLLPVVRR